MKRFFIIVSFFLLFTSTLFASSQQTSGITAQDIINRVQYNLNATSDSFFTTADMLDWVNQGILDIVNRSQCLQSSYEKTLVADTYEYDISGDFDYLEITSVVYKDTYDRWTGLVKTTPENLTLGMENFPKFWYENNVGSKIVVFPTLDDVTGSPSIIIFYVSKPTAITAGNIDVTSIPIPAKYDQSLIYYVTHKALEKDRRDSTSLYNKYLESLANIKAGESK
jgi:hypothetical protein